MSYLISFEQRGPLSFAVQWRSVRGIIRTTPTGHSVVYKRYTRLGERLRNNHEFERKYIADAIEKTTGIRPIYWSGVTSL